MIEYLIGDESWTKKRRKKVRIKPKRMFPEGLKTISDAEYGNAFYVNNPLETTIEKKNQLIRGGTKRTYSKYATKTIYNRDTGKVEEVKIKEEGKRIKHPFGATKNRTNRQISKNY